MSTKMKPNQFTLPSGVVITETGLICQPDMAAAIYLDRKTETRRTNGLDSFNSDPDFWNRKGNPMKKIVRFWDSSIENDPNPLSIQFGFKDPIDCIEYVNSVYGKPGDMLYVRENFKLGAWREEDGRMAFDYMASPELTNTHWCRFTDEEDPDGDKFQAFWEKATNQLLSKGIEPDQNGQFCWEAGKSPLNWKPSIHMPKAASRLWLMIEEIRVERVLDITEEDAKAEGVQSGEGLLKGSCLFYDYESKQYSLTNPKSSFKSLWKSINGEESWTSNPWVWVVKFRLLSKTGRPSMEVISDSYRQVVNRKEASHA